MKGTETGMEALAASLAAAIAAERACVAVVGSNGLRFVAAAPAGPLPEPMALDELPSLRRDLAKGIPFEDGAELSAAVGGESRLVVPLALQGRTVGAIVLVDSPMPHAAAAEMLEGAVPLAAAHLETWLGGEQLRAAAHYLLDAGAVRQFSATSSDAVRVIDLDGRVLSWNRASEHMYGWTEAEVLGSQLPYLSSEKRPMLLADLRRMAMTMAPFEREATHVRKDGSQLRVRVFVRPVFDDEHQVVAVALARQISSDVLLDSAYDGFCDLVSDSLRNPLAAITGFAQLLRRPEILDDPVRRRRALDALESHTTRLSMLVDDLLLLSGASAGTLRHDPEALDLVAIVTDVVAEFEGRSGHRFVIDVEARLPALVADGQRVRQALGHLLANATTYAPVDGSIWVTLTRHGEEAVVAVRDEGEGIPSDDLERVFDRFVRGSRARGHGAGIGLYAVRLIAEAHGGSASVLSEPEAGCTAILRLPLQS